MNPDGYTQDVTNNGDEPTCGWEMPPEPCQIVIFGASGDLTRRKLIPAYYGLFISGGMPSSFCVVGAARSPLNDDDFRDDMREGTLAAGHDMSNWDEFAKKLFYWPVRYNDLDTYHELARCLQGLEDKYNFKGGRIFNLALPPSLYGPVSTLLGKAGLNRQDLEKGRWSRLVVEKPFGHDLDSARELNRTIGKWFKESQVFRIDHYMAKETVQNILLLRFANAIFEPLWNRHYIKHVRINAAEQLGVGKRAGYYEQSGVIRDMMQNHMIQLLTLVAMEPPSWFDANRLRDKQAEILSSLRHFPLEAMKSNLVLGQYTAGETANGPAVGYKEEEGVSPDSTTPTFAALKVYIDNWRWKGVPFYITTGKQLKRKITRVDIVFRNVPHRMFPRSLGQDIRANRLVLGIYPSEEVFITFQAKRPGAQLCMRPAGLRFNYSQANGDSLVLDAYQKALLDTMAGDQTLFWREDCLELAWSYFDPILQAMDSCSHDICDLHPYAAGTDGPEAALDLLPYGSWPEKL
jgi:glucose-6-phosphate 1-dehydrogenase